MTLLEYDDLPGERGRCSLIGEEAQACLWARGFGRLENVLGWQCLTGCRLDEPGRIVVIARREQRAAEIAQHCASLHGGQLILVADQDQARRRGQRLQQGRHHFEVNHRGLVNDHQIGCDRMRGVVAKSTRVRGGAEQSMERARRTDLMAERSHIKRRLQNAGQCLE